MRIKKTLLFLFAFITNFTWASAVDATPKKVGPVSYYGALHTQGNKIIGSKNNERVMLRGISLYWSDATGLPYYQKKTINWATDNLKIDMFRFAMGTQYYDSGSKPMDESYTYIGAPDKYLNLVDDMVATAIENDIYIIIDWHSHRAHLETSYAQTFFKEIAQKYKDIPNVIFEIYNEPVDASGGNWSNIKTYANTISASIRQYTENLIVVGTSFWSQNPQEGANDPVSATNIAYVLHFYAAEHSNSSFSGKIESTLNRGYPVFISEWGTTNADGDGAPDNNATNTWTNYMDKNFIPNCNWSFRQYTSHTDGKSEQSAFWAGSTPLLNEKSLDEAEMTASGTIVQKYLVNNARSWADSITKGKRSGSCANSHLTLEETAGTVTNKLNSSCSYTSSDESVVSISGSSIIVKSFGYAILTGNDGSESVVTIKQIPNQTINGFMKVECNYTGSCSTDKGSSRTLDYDNDGNKEWTFPATMTTDQGSTFTLTSLNPSFISAKKATCSSVSCSGAQYNNDVWMYQFNDFGSAKIVATAPAVTGYRALSDTIEIIYKKGENRISGFGSKKVDPGVTIEKLLPDTTVYGTPITYTFDGESTSPYIEKVGINAVVSSQKAIVKITATAPETDVLAPMTKVATITIGDTVATFTDKLLITLQKNNFSAKVTSNKTLQINSNNQKPIEVRIFDLKGNIVKRKFMESSHSLSLKDIPYGSYVIQVKQNSQNLTIRWNSL